jgi:hypothetical protein
MTAAFDAVVHRSAYRFSYAVVSLAVLALGGTSFADVVLVSQSREVFASVEASSQIRTAPDFGTFVNNAQVIANPNFASTTQSSSISPSSFSFAGSGVAFGGPSQARSLFMVVFDVLSPQTFNVLANRSSQSASLAPGSIRLRLFTDLSTVFSRELFPLQPFSRPNLFSTSGELTPGRYTLEVGYSITGVASAPISASGEGTFEMSVVPAPGAGLFVLAGAAFVRHRRRA